MRRDKQNETPVWHHLGIPESKESAGVPGRHVTDRQVRGLRRADSFDIGRVHFVVLDDVRYPCNGVDDHEFCHPAAKPAFNGVIHARQLEWLRNDLARIPRDKLIVVNAHIPFVSYTDATRQRGQIDKRNPRPKLTRFLSREEVQRLHRELDHYAGARLRSEPDAGQRSHARGRGGDGSASSGVKMCPALSA